MILSKDSNDNWTPTAGGNGTFIGTTAAFNAIKDTLPVNTVAYITDDGNGDLQPVDAVTNGDMHPVTSNAVYDYPIDSITDGQHRPPTSNAVYDALNTVTAGNIPNIGNWVRYGKVVHFIINSSSTYLPDGGTFTLPFKPVLGDSFPTWWGSTFFGWIDISVNGTVEKKGGTNANLYSSFTYITNE